MADRPLTGLGDVVPGDVTLNEVWRRMNRMDIDQRERMAAIDSRMGSLASQTVPLNVYEERHGNLRSRVKSLEDRAEAALVYRRNMTIAIVSSLVTSVAAVIASILAVHVH